MADLKFQPVRLDHKAFLERASKRRGFKEAYVDLAVAAFVLDTRGATMQAQVQNACPY